jgi:hypothetical protein
MAADKTGAACDSRGGLAELLNALGLSKENAKRALELQEASRQQRPPSNSKPIDELQLSDENEA